MEVYGSLTQADKTSNVYKITKEKYKKLLHNTITKTNPKNKYKFMIFDIKHFIF